ncbi:hypothetical protein MicB006_4384 [Micromonospora sp. B006]|nr:hypothetical protein MicB006_4384 [Micromonospora sp. B006]
MGTAVVRGHHDAHRRPVRSPAHTAPYGPIGPGRPVRFRHTRWQLPHAAATPSRVT